MEPVVLVRDRDRVYGDCLPKSPQPATRAWRSSTRVRQALRPTHNMKNVWFGALCRSICQGRVGGGWEGLLTERDRAPCRRIRPGRDGPPMMPQQYIRRCRDVSLKKECVRCGPRGYVEDTIVYRPKASATSPHPHVASAPLALTMADSPARSVVSFACGTRRRAWGGRTTPPWSTRESTKMSAGGPTSISDGFEAAQQLFARAVDIRLLGARCDEARQSTSDGRRERREFDHVRA